MGSKVKDEDENVTTVRIKVGLKKYVEKQGRYGESFNDVLERLVRPVKKEESQ